MTRNDHPAAHGVNLYRSLTRPGPRRRLGLFAIEGIRQFVQAVDCGWEFERLLVSNRLLIHPLARRLSRHLARDGTTKHNLSPEQSRNISRLPRASGIAAIVRQRWTSLEAVATTPGLCWLAIDRFRSPGNLGTILRTAAAVGAAGVIVLDRDADPFDPQVVTTSMGGLFHLQFVRADVVELRRQADLAGQPIFALHPSDDVSLPVPSDGPPPVLLVGEERRGLTERALSLADGRLSLPMPGWADSLNVGVASGVAMYELLRRRSATRPSAPDAAGVR